MIRRFSARRSAPAFLAGTALAIGTQVGTGLLLYGGPGLLQALSVILATAAVALGMGLASKSGGSVEEARRAWLLLLLAFTAAATFSGGWEVFRGFGARPLTQGLGLALLIALPLYLGGRLFVQLAQPSSGTWAPGPPALVGGAVGLLVLGHLFFPALSPTAVLLLCVVAVSGGALTHGWLLDEVIAEETVETGDPGLIVRRSRRSRPPLDLITVEEVPSVRLVRGGDGGPLLPVDIGLEDDLLASLSPPARVLAIGWRVVPAAARLTPPGAALSLVHPMAEGVRALLATLPGSTRPSEEVEIVGASASGCRFEALAAADWVLVDAAELPGLGDHPWSRLRELLRPGGTLVLVGATETGRGGEHRTGGGGLLAPLREGARFFGSAAAYVGPASAEGAGDTAGAVGREGLLVFAPEEGRAWADTAGRLLLVLPGED